MSSSLSELHGSPYSKAGEWGVSGKPLPPLRQVPLCLFICNNQMVFQIVSSVGCCINTALEVGSEQKYLKLRGRKMIFEMIPCLYHLFFYFFCFRFAVLSKLLQTFAGTKAKASFHLFSLYVIHFWIRWSSIMALTGPDGTLSFQMFFLITPVTCKLHFAIMTSESFRLTAELSL